MVENSILRLENKEIPWINYFLTFLFATFLRDFIEAFSQPVNYFSYPSTKFLYPLIHFTLSYFMLALMLIGLFSSVCKIAVSDIARVVFPGFVLLLVAPLTDLVITMGHGAFIHYISPSLKSNILLVYLSYFGFGFTGVTVGIKVEIILALAIAFIYCKIKGQNFCKCLISIWLCYTIIFILFALPYFITCFLELIGFDFKYSSFNMIRFYLLGIFVVGTPLLYSASPNIFNQLVKDCHFLRVLHFALMLILGAVISLTRHQLPIHAQLLQHQDILINLILCLISIFFARLFSAAMNDIAEFLHKKPHIPSGARNDSRIIFIKENMSLYHYQILAYSSVFISLFYASMVNTYAFFFITVIIASSYIYSMPPLQFKRIPILSKLVISLSSIALILLGYILVNGTIKDFPNELFLIYFIGGTIAANVIDIKSIPYDKAAGIITLPTMLTKRHATLLIGIAFWATYISFIFLNPTFNLLLCLSIAGGMQFYIINQTVYREWLVLAFYNASMITLIYFLISFHDALFTTY